MIGRKALITGGSRGLGEALAHRLASEGASVTLVAKHHDRLQQSLASLPTNHHQNHSTFPIDLTDLTKVSSLNPQIFDDISILINCAGITNHSLLSRISPDEIINTINVNLTVPIILSKLACKTMLRHKSESKPTILNVSSILASHQFSLPGTSVYTASKSGLNGFTQCLSSEFKGRIRVNSILPGLISETDMGAAVKHDDIKPVDIDSVVEKCLQIIGDDTINGECIEINENLK